MSRSTLLTLIGILLAMFLGALDQTIVATALPKIVEDLQGLDRFSWVATSYLVASTAFVPIYGKLADLYTHKKIEIFAIVTFLSGSVLCGMAGEFGTLPLLGDGMSQLIIFRAIQGVGGAGLFAMAFIIIAGLFPASERGKYQGLVGAVFGISSVLGPWLGGLLTDHAGAFIPGIAGWRWVFYVNIPFGALALWFISSKMPAYRTAENTEAKLDYLAALMLILALAPLVIVLQIDKSQFPWTSPTVLALSILSALSFVLFYQRSRNSDNPILNLQLFKNPVFRTANPPTFLIGAAFMGLLMFLPLFLINVQGANATDAGLGMIPLSVGLLLASTLSGQLVSRMGNYRLLLLIGGFIFFIGMYLLSAMDENTSYSQILWYMLICGIGLGPAMPLYPLAIQNAVPREVLGQATSANQFFRQIGSAIGASVLGAMLTVSLSGSFRQIQSEQRGGKVQLEELMQEGSVAVSRSFRQETELQLSELQSRSGSSENFEQAKKALNEKMAAEEAEIHQAIQRAFADAITTLFRSLLVVIGLAWLFNWFIPLLPLKKH